MTPQERIKTAGYCIEKVAATGGRGGSHTWLAYAKAGASLGKFDTKGEAMRACLEKMEQDNVAV